MIAYSIVINGNETSEAGYTNLVESSKRVGNKFPILKFEAITPEYVDRTMQSFKIKWNYPWEGQVSDFETGLVKSAYQTANPNARIACGLSHYSLWKQTINLSEPVLVLEHDACFVNQVDFDITKTGFDILGINNPLGCTRKSQTYYDEILKNQRPYQLVPVIDEPTIPQGLAGNSAYIITPSGAEQLISLVRQYGLWPNDAIMCRQLVRKLGVTRKFYTNRQNLRSTTTL